MSVKVFNIEISYRILIVLALVFTAWAFIEDYQTGEEALFVVPTRWIGFTDAVSKKYGGKPVQFNFVDDQHSLQIYIVGTGVLRGRERDLAAAEVNPDLMPSEKLKPIKEELNALAQWTIDFINSNDLYSDLIKRDTRHITFGFKSSLSNAGSYYAITHEIGPEPAPKADLESLSGATLLDYGMYRKNSVDSQKYKNKKYTVYELIGNQTDSIPAQLNTSFGFRYFLNGEPAGALVKTRTIYSFPPMTNPQTGEDSTEDEFWAWAPIGARQLGSFYTFKEPWNVRPGVWKIALYHEQKLLLEKTFQVIESHHK